MAFTFYKDKGQEDIGEQKPIRPFRAFAREGATSLAGTYGDILSLIPGYQSGQPTQATQQQISREAQAQGPEFLRQILANAAQPDIISQTGTFPSSEQVSSFLDMLGIPKQEEADVEKFAGRFGRLSGGGAALTGNIPLSVSTGLTGGLGGYLAEKAGFGPTGQAVSEFLASLRGAKPKPAPSTGKITQPRVVAEGKIPKEAGFVTGGRVEKQLERVATEAAELGKDIGKGHPVFQKVSAAIEQGKPIQESLTKAFETLEDAARTYNPAIDAKPLNDFLSKEAALYQKTGAPTALGEFVMEQINGWMKSGKDSLYNMFRRYRLNNQKFDEVLKSVEDPKLRSQMLSYLTRMNDAIKASFNRTFSSKGLALPGQKAPKNVWLDAFEQTNAANSAFSKTKQVRKVLDPLLSKNMTNSQLSEFLQNKNLWEDMGRFLGKGEAGKLKTILHDMQKARNGLEGMKQLNVSQELLNTFFKHNLPYGVGKVADLFSTVKFWKFIQGAYNSGPAAQKNIEEFLKAMTNKNLPAATNALKNISSAKEEKKKEKESALPFTFFPLQKK